MIAVNFDPTQPPHDQWYAEWQVTAQARTQEVIDEFDAWLKNTTGPKPGFDASTRTKVWTALKEYLHESIFHQKCAYCETPSTGFYPDAEHFRPKGRVAVKTAAGRQMPRCKLPDGREIEHPGYFWLAFHWRNLVPSCKTCNTGAGKVDQFPTGKPHRLLEPLTAMELAGLNDPAIESKTFPGHYYLGPQDLDRLEETLLLNPMNASASCQPRRHLIFGVRGIVTAAAGSRLGEESIRVFNLDSEPLRRARQRQLEAAHLRYYNHLGGHQALDGVKVGGLADPAEPYSEAVRQYLLHIAKRQEYLTRKQLGV